MFFFIVLALGVGLQSAPPAYCQLGCVGGCLQRKSLAAAEGLSPAVVTIRTLKSMRADDKCALFCKDVTTLTEHNLMDGPVLPRRRRLPEHDMTMETPPLNSMRHRSPDTDTFRPTLKQLISKQCI